MHLKTPPKCLICGSDWRGGHALPNALMIEGLRVFYECGASLSFVAINEVYRLMIKNCGVNNEPKNLR